MNIQWKEESSYRYIGEIEGYSRFQVYGQFFYDGWYADLYTSAGSFSREINNPKHEQGAWPTLEAAQQACQEAFGLNQ